MPCWGLSVRLNVRLCLSLCLSDFLFCSLHIFECVGVGLHLCLSICLSASLLSGFRLVFLHHSVAVYPDACLSICMSVFQLCFSLSRSYYILSAGIDLVAYPSVNLCVFLYVCLPAYLFFHLVSPLVCWKYRAVCFSVRAKSVSLCLAWASGLPSLYVSYIYTYV